MTNDANALGRTLHIRALNHLRRDHPLTYVAARNLAESIHEEGLESWTLGHLKRRVTTERPPVYWQYSLFKAIDGRGLPENRNCLIGSPTTHLAEIWTLWRISQDQAFRTPASVYSYLWSHPKSKQPFQNFLKGYRRRERAISDAALTLKDPYVVVLDLKQFYPSIDVTLAFERFAERIKASGLEGHERDMAIESARGVCRPRKYKGLPIGPPLAHTIASVFLEDLDEILEREFPGRYFRYVDDVALVVEREDTDRAQNIFSRAAAADGLKVNEDKTDVHAGTLWKHRVTSREDLDRGDTFGSLITGLTQYLAHNPEEFDAIRSMFRGDGFALPFTRVRSVAEYGPFRRLARRALRAFGLQDVFKSVRPAGLLATAHALRSQFTERARDLADSEIPSNGMERRWAIQNRRFAFNRLLYLLPESELKGHREMLPALPDMASTKAVYDALVTGDATGLADYPGPTTSAFCQLWRERHDERPVFEPPYPTKRHHRDSVSTLALYGLWTPTTEWIETFDVGNSQPALRIASGERPIARTHQDFSYIDEVESLCMAAQSSPLQLLESRFDKEESISLPALSLGNGSAT